MAAPSNETILKAIKGSRGVVLTVSKKLRVDWHTAKGWIDAEPELLQAMKAEKESILDIAEVGLYALVRDQDLAAIKYLLSTQGKSRGYVERKEIGGENGDPIKTESFISLLMKTSAPVGSD